MKESTIHKVGKWICIFGVVVLVLAILLAFTAGSFLTGKMIVFSIFVNTVGIVLLRYKKEDTE